MTETTIKPASKKHTTMYEFSEADPKNDYYGSQKHYQLFPDFIRTLGFDVENSLIGLETQIKIDGEKFSINYDKTSGMAKNAYERTWKPRKDRCIELLYSGYPDKVIAKIKFNEEINQDALVKKIEKAINEKKAVAKQIDDRNKNEFNQADAMRKHYFANRVISAYVERIYINKGILGFYFYGGTIKIDADTNSFKEFIAASPNPMSLINIKDWAVSTKATSDTVLSICAQIEILGAVGTEFAEYAKEAYNRSVTKDEVCNY